MNAQREGKDAPEKKSLADLTESERTSYEQKARMNHYQKRKAEITVGIQEQERIHEVKERITKRPCGKMPCAKFVYGNDWYICADEEGRVIEEYIDSSLREDATARKTYEEERSNYEQNEEIAILAVKQKIKGVTSKVMQKTTEGIKHVFYQIGGKRQNGEER